MEIFKCKSIQNGQHVEVVLRAETCKRAIDIVKKVTAIMVKREGKAQPTSIINWGCEIYQSHGYEKEGEEEMLEPKKLNNELKNME